MKTDKNGIPIHVPFSKNKLRTAGYFMKRLRDNGFVVLKMFAFYAKTDPRLWTVMVNPGEASVFITCAKDGVDDYVFEFNDGGRYIPKNYSIKTLSVEVVVEYLIKRDIVPHVDYPGRYKFISHQINTFSAKEAEKDFQDQQNTSTTPQ